MYKEKQFWKELAVYVKHQRVIYGLSQQQLEEQTHVARRQISRLETGNNPMQTDTINAILKPLGKDAETAYQEVAVIRTQFDNQIKYVADLIYNQKWEEIKALVATATEQFSAYQHIPHYRQGILYLQATTKYKQSWEEATQIYLEALKTTRPDLILDSNVHSQLIDTEKLSTTALQELEYGLTRQIATGLGCLGNRTHAIDICQALLTSFTNPAVSHDTKKLLTASIYANLAWLYNELNDTEQACHYINQGIACCHQTGNNRSLPYLQNLQNQLCNPT